MIIPIGHDESVSRIPFVTCAEPLTARQVLQQLIARYEGSPFADRAREILASLGTAAPGEGATASEDRDG